MQETGVHNGAFGADKFGFKKLKAGALESRRARSSIEHSLPRGEAVLSAEGALVRRHRRVHRPLAEGQVHGARCDHREDVWWGGNQSITSEQFETLYARFHQARRRHVAVRAGSLRRCRSDLPHQDPRLHRTRLALAVHPHAADPPRAAELASFVPELTIIDLPSFKADPKRHGVRSENVVAIDFARKIVLIGGSYYAGEMKKSVFTTLNYYLPEQGRDADALLGQCRPRGRHRDLLRPVRHRQDHALRRSEPHADRRRRARLGQGRHLQFRRRLLRQVHQAVAGSRARDLCGQQALRRGARERRARSKTRACRISTTARRPRTPARPIRSTSSRMPRAPAAPVSRRIW